MTHQKLVSRLVAFACASVLAFVAGTDAVAAATTTTSTTTRDVQAQTTATTTCAQSWPANITNYSVMVGSNTFPKLASVKPGDTVTVHFTLLPNCHEQLSLASYEAKTLDTSQSGVVSQTLADSDTGNFGPGAHTLTVTIHDCMFQVDFVRGPVITKFGPVGSNNFYAGRIFDTATGGKTECVSVKGEEITTTTTTPVPPTTAAPEVLGETITAPTSTLPFTGMHLGPVVALGLVLLSLGGFFLGAIPYTKVLGRWMR